MSSVKVLSAAEQSESTSLKNSLATCPLALFTKNIMVPKYLYKYVDYFIESKNSKRINYAKRNIVNNQIYFSNKNSLNDPYEIRFNVIDCEDYSLQCPAVWEGPKRMFEHWYEQFFKNIGICSLSAKNNNMIMFSHYANDHNGICLQYDTTKDEIFRKGFPINYRNSIPYIFYSDYWKFIKSKKKDYEKLKAVFSTKHQDWIYEEEWRILHTIQSNQNGYTYNVNPECLSAIIFGLNADNSIVTEIMKIIKEKNHNINLFESILNTSTYGLDLKPIINEL
ncbi:MAG: DUF2971 domain-containing protein [Candidatus Lokiarchaeota archaeon]|nr:DUF2971 domain-containing protein [Candidatus Lokiarchaeota archaeon]